MAKGKRQTTTQTYTPPSWVEDSAKEAVDIGRRIGSQEYKPYSGERVAGLSQNEQQGIDLARASVGNHQPYIDESRALAKRGSQQFTDANMKDYMNPYIKSALDPTAREIRDQGARTLNTLDAKRASMNAFGGSRSALMRSEAVKNTDQAISDLYKTGMSDAFDRATQLWGSDRARDMQASGQLLNLGQAVKSASTADVNTLMATGATDRSIQQSMKDFDYKQFTEERDWDLRNLGGLLAALDGTKGSYTTTQTSEKEGGSNPLGQVIGLATTLFGAFYGGGGGAALAGGAAGSGSGGWADQSIAAGVG